MTDYIPTFRFDGHLTIVTGACGGLAEALIKGLLAYGSDIALLDIDQEKTAAKQAEYHKYATEELKLKEVPKMGSYACDISDSDTVHKVFAQVAKDFGKLPLHLVNTAGYCENFPCEDYPAKNAEKMVKVNLLGSLYVSQAFAKPLIKEGIKGASVVLIGSMSGAIVNDPQNQVVYNMSKAGVIHLAKTLACEWAKYNIRVNSLNPGYIYGPLTKNVINGNEELYNRWISGIPQQRMSEPKEYIGAVLYLLSESAASYTTGASLLVDGGFTSW
ncbi:unnamed protein product [Ambrosiozyma monospora]|uniref:NADH-dependent L-xylulose reductase n=2 Tax=Ambrosiozyma monospora TaxID=43982 RepID=ALX1_AMBMO